MSENQELKKLLQDVSYINKDPELRERIEKCNELIEKLETKEPTQVKPGILSQFFLNGKVALVTGGGQGIGRVFSHALGEAGCKVAVADIEFDKAENVAAELKNKGIESMAIKVNVSDKKDVENMVQQVLNAWNDLHIACNNAGIVFNSAGEDTSQTEWDRTMGVNLDGVFFCCQAEAKHMLTKRYGKIINTASLVTKVIPKPQKQAAYNISKAEVVHLTKTLGAEWANKGVRVNSISPGYVFTPLLQSDSLAGLRDIWKRDIPMGRFAEVDDLIGALLYLASPLSDYMTGTDIVIDGGYTCW